MLDLFSCSAERRDTGYHMPEAQLSNPRKRRNPERLTPQQNKTSQHVSKKQKRSHPNGSQLPPAFWDNLSKIDLTKRALEELDRRSTQAAPNSQLPYPRSHQPITRHVLAELKKSLQSLAPAAYYLCHCGIGGMSPQWRLHCLIIATNHRLKE